MERDSIVSFVNHLMLRLYKPEPIANEDIIEAFKTTLKDIQYHYPNVDSKLSIERIITNQNELAVYLFRLGRLLHTKKRNKLKMQVHFLLKDVCGCEIYFNTSIEEGFYVVHGEGTVIGSRNTIGKGFIIHQGCTIGHKINGEGKGSIIGNDVKLYCNASILGALKIGDNVTIGAHSMVNKDVASNSTIVSSSRLEYL